MTTSQRLTNMIEAALNAQGYADAKVRWMTPAKGHERTGGGDFYRWSAGAQYGNLTLSIDSYTTMTKIVRSGGVLLERDTPTSFDAYDATGN